jgi:tetratricopeptide (TPR) repeat protein
MTRFRSLRCILALLTSAFCVVRGSAADTPSEALAAYMLSIPDRARAEPPPSLPNFDNALTRLLAQSQALAEAGRYGEAAQKIQQLQSAPALPNVILPKYIEEWTRERLAALQEMEHRVDVATLRAFYLEAKPHWFRKRWQPIVAAWSAPSPDEVSRLRLVADLFRQAEDVRGHRLALLALVDTGKLQPREVADALLEAGNRAHEEKQSAVAVASWERIVREYSGTSPWFMALFNLGVERREGGAYREAVGHFTRLVESAPPNREPGEHLMQNYRNYAHQAALHISDCHEALGDIPAALHWAQFALEKYRLEAWCGTCAEASAEAMTNRITRLSAKIR